MIKKTEIIKENLMVIIIFILLGSYYLYRMFSITPWYDEIFTYVKFINEGVIYSATHWPAPNNHIFFSIMSALINWCGNYIGLRGISYLAAMGTVILLYCFFKEIFSKNTALVIVLSYSMLMLTNKLAVQGRGYSLATFFLMLAVYCGYCICYKADKEWNYVLWAISLWLGLYTVVTSIYWVSAICLCCGIVLLVLKRYKKFFKLISYSLGAAFVTVISYGIMWFSIGAQQISLDVTTGYFGADVWFLIKKFPRTCLMRGIEFMTSDRSVQGIDRNAFLGDFHFFGRGILSAFFGKTEMWYFYGLLIVMIISFVIFIFCIIRNKTKYIYYLSMSSIGFLGIFITLWVQSAYPFIRVFSFLGVFLIVPIGLFYGFVAEFFKKIIRWKYINIVVCLLATIMAGFSLTSPLYMMEYDFVDYYAYDAIKHIEWESVGTYLVSDFYAEQQVEFHQIIGEERELQVDLDSPEVIIAKKASLTGEWPDMITDEMLEKCYIEERPILYENELYIVYGQ